jgi:mycoredoxin
MSATNEPAITIYGTATCADCRRSRALLDGYGVAYRYIGIDEDAEAADYVRRENGRTSTPYIVLNDGSSMTEPTDAELRARLVDLELLPR